MIPRWLRVLVAEADDALCPLGPDSDILLRDNHYGFTECAACKLDGYFAAWSTSELITHVREHKAAGHKVPDDLIPMLRGDA